ncbi:CkIIbeta2 [Nucleospora cyclopteri]
MSKNTSSENSEIDYEDFWMGKFSKVREHGLLERIPDSYIQDKFNLMGLKNIVEDFDEAHMAISDNGPSLNILEETKLYYYTHQRYITFNKQGMSSMLDKIKNKEFGCCPRYGCKEAMTVPIGISNEYGKSKTKIYCYNCNNCYEPKGSLKKLDGCIWGTAFAPMLILSNPYHFKPKPVKTFVPKLFGFTVNYEIEEQGNSASSSIEDD